MKTIKILLFAAIMLVATLAQAQQVGTSYTESYRLYGIEVFGDDFVHPGVSATVEGVELSGIAHKQEGEAIEYWGARAGYKLPQLIDGVDITAGYGYSVLPGVDLQEISLTAAIPGTISPRCTIIHAMPDNHADDGQVYVIGIDATLGCPDAINAVLSCEAVYNDGVNPFGGPIVRDFTHMLSALTVNVPVGDNITISPAVLYQHTFEEAVEPDKNEVWGAVSLKYEF